MSNADLICSGTCGRSARELRIRLGEDTEAWTCASCLQKHARTVGRFRRLRHPTARRTLRPPPDPDEAA
jgi:hypothetical protein